MGFSQKVCLLGAACFLMTWRGGAGDFNLESAGGRFGFDGHSGAAFHQAEAFADWKLPWGWAPGEHWRFRTGLDVSAGWLGDNQANAGVFTAGPLVALGYKGFPLFIEGGSSPTVLTRSDFHDVDFGIPFQFTSHIGISWDVTAHWRLGYRFQHMSNAGLASENPGRNLHMFSVSYRF